MATKQEILASLTPEQRDVVINYSGKNNLEACPGSGKTATMVATIQYMLKDGVPPSKILAFTFTKKAATELKERVKKAVGVDADKVMICTYHSFCGRVLRGCAQYAGRESNFTIYDEDDKRKILTDVIKSFSKTNKCIPMKYATAASYISRFKIDNLSPAEAKKFRSDTSYGKASALIYEVYEEKMRQLNAFDFDDLPFFAYRIVKTNPEILEAISSRFEYVLSDENQDSNRQNMNFILLLGSHSHNIMVVGDTDQSIYGFRGSDVKNIINVVKNEGFKTKYLSTNFRSTQNIVNAANCIIQNNKNRIVKTVDTVNEIGDSVELVKVSNTAYQASYVAKKIKQLVNNNEELKYGDICILSRTQHQLAELEETLLLEHVPYTSKYIVPFYSRAEIKDILSYLKFAFNGNDMLSFLRAANTPKRGIGDASLEKITNCLPDKRISDIINNDEALRQLRIPVKARQGIKEFSHIIDEVRSKIEENTSPDSIIGYIIEETKYMDYLIETVDNRDTLQLKEQNLVKLMELAVTFSSVSDLLTNTTFEEPETEEEEKPDAINIMTMHSSKGLEFPVVFIINVEDDSIPFVFSHKSADNIEEERRLFYVACTRAKKKLFLVYPKVVNAQYGAPRAAALSRFVKEIPENYLLIS